MQEIERKYIESIPRIAQDALHRDEAVENGDYIQGGSREDSSMIINVEGQTNFYPGYPLSKRGIYYGSRMISAQYGTVFTRSHYEKLEKVYSIWVCLNPPKYRKNSINVY